MDAFRAATVEAARLDPNVASVQFGTTGGDDGMGTDWAVAFSEKDYNVDVQFDAVKKHPSAHRQGKLATL